ncbi:MAG: selenocysteine-specific translation elongation factor [Chloroflexi bacterium]|nr:selenocysteine-specific translation elongation factor [Chloroflexota bacterium]
MRVVGTAGHVDHGKSTLIHALTGIDPDRLQEEKDRGMTIDLGFAWLTLPSGQEVSIVDVPGHERFIHNMLAGVGGIDIALLIVAADEGVMPQTREHLDILDLLAVPSGAVVLTKTDLVDEEWLELVTAEVEETVKGTVMEGAPIVPVSAVTGAGLADLAALLDRLLAQERTRTVTGRPRLPIDRVFTIAGFGTVVTGTLLDGELRVGQEIEIQPGRRRTRIRGLQSHRRKVERAQAGSRVAVNLVGVATEDLTRGQVLVEPGTLTPTRLVDAKVRVLADAPRPLVHNMALTFHIGAAEATAKAALLDRQELGPGDTGWVQLRLGHEVAAARGDLFVIRTPSPSQTLGGGTILEPHPRRHRRHQAQVLERLSVLEQGTPHEIVLQQLRAKEPSDVAGLVGRTGLAADEARAAIGTLVASGDIVTLSGARAGEHRLTAQTLVVTRDGWQRLVGAVQGGLGSFHRAYPLRRGMPKEELRTRLGLESRLFVRLLERLLSEGLVVEAGPLLRLPEHQVAFSVDEQRQADRLLGTLRDAGASPPSRDEVEARFGVSPELTQALLDRGDLVEVAADLVYPADVLDVIKDEILTTIRERGSLTVAGVRDLFDTSRKYALALLAYLDDRKITRRVGDERVLY